MHYYRYFPCRFLVLTCCLAGLTELYAAVECVGSFMTSFVRSSNQPSWKKCTANEEIEAFAKSLYQSQEKTKNLNIHELNKFLKEIASIICLSKFTSEENEAVRYLVYRGLSMIPLEGAGKEEAKKSLDALLRGILATKSEGAQLDCAIQEMTYTSSSPILESSTSRSNSGISSSSFSGNSSISSDGSGFLRRLRLSFSANGASALNDFSGWENQRNDKDVLDAVNSTYANALSAYVSIDETALDSLLKSIEEKRPKNYTVASQAAFNYLVYERLLTESKLTALAKEKSKMLLQKLITALSKK